MYTQVRFETNACGIRSFSGWFTRATAVKNAYDIAPGYRFYITQDNPNEGILTLLPIRKEV